MAKKKRTEIVGITKDEWHFQEAVEGERITDVSPLVGGINAWLFKVKDGDQIYHTKDIDRAEVRVKDEVMQDIWKKGSSYKISYYLYIPNNFPYYPDMGHLVFSQFHHQGNGSPVMGIQYHELEGIPSLALKVRSGVHAGAPVEFHSMAVLKGVMNQKLIIEYKPSTSSDGYLRMSWDGSNEYGISYEGPTQYEIDNAQVKGNRLNFKCGIYRSGLYPDDMQIGIGDFYMARS